MKRLIWFGISLFLLSSCGTKKVEDQKVLDDIAESLNARWEVTNDNSKGIIEAALEGTQSELTSLYIYDASDTLRFKNSNTEKLLDDYISVLLETESILSESLEEKYLDISQWEELKIKRSEILNDFNEILPIPVKQENKSTLEEVFSYKDSEVELVHSNKQKIGFSAETISNSNFNELINDNFSLVDSVYLDNEIKMDVFSNEHRVLKLLVFTLPNEEYSSAFSVVNSLPIENGYKGFGNNGFIKEMYEDIVEVLVATIPQETIHFVQSNSIQNEDIYRTDYVYGNEINLETINDGVAKIPAKPQLKPIKSSEDKKESAIPKQGTSALNSARSYLKSIPFSKKGLLNQLTSEYGENYPLEAAQYAIDNVTTDWKNNALKAAKSYQESIPMSLDDLYEQLISDFGDQYTPEEAQYAIDNLPE